MNSSIVGTGVVSSFVDINNTIYVGAPSRQQAQVWFVNSTSPSRVFPTAIVAPRAIFAGINGDVFVDDGSGRARVDRWIGNASTPITAMFVSEHCWSLFIDTHDQLYCSQDTSARVIRKSLLWNINQTTILAGTGGVGSAADMLYQPRGIFVDLNMTLYVADCANHRVQRFRAGERNGTTIAGNGSSGTIALNRPLAVILDGNGYLFIADTSNNRIVASGPNGFRCIVGCVPGMTVVNYPRTIHFDSDGNLLVMIAGSSRLLKFLLATNPCGKQNPPR
jgi:DNA-binding beta-propeller fold protein YncE